MERLQRHGLYGREKITLPSQANNKLGALLIIVATLSLTIKDVADKFLVQDDYHPLQMVFFRFAIPFVLLAIFMPKQTKIAILATNKKLLLRAILFLFCAVTSVLALKYIPLEVYLILVQMGSIVLMLGGALFFNETLTPLKITATLIGFVGVVIVINPTGVGSINWLYLLPILITVASAAYNLITKSMKGAVSVTSVLINAFFLLGLASVIGLAVQPSLWREITLDALPYFVLIPLATIVSQYCLIKAMQIAEASQLAPFFYFQILFAGIFGYWLFNEIPTVYSLVGGAFIIAASVLVIYSNRKV